MRTRPRLANKITGGSSRTLVLNRPRQTVLLLAMPDAHHETVYFSGRVQGVGFRYQTMQMARGFEVSGFVQNLPDGRVLLEAEGTAAEVAAFVTALEEQMTGYIRKTERHHAGRKPQFRGFAIR